VLVRKKKFAFSLPNGLNLDSKKNIKNKKNPCTPAKNKQKSYRNDSFWLADLLCYQAIMASRISIFEEGKEILRKKKTEKADFFFFFFYNSRKNFVIHS